MSEFATLPFTGPGGDPTGKVVVDENALNELVQHVIDHTEDLQDQQLIATALSAGASVDLDCADITTGRFGRLLAVDIGGSVPLRVDIQVVNGSRVTRTSVYSVIQEQWRAPHIKAIEVAGGVGIHFGVSVVNLSPLRTADGRVTMYWDEVAP
jgi:hypothetical protein